MRVFQIPNNQGSRLIAWKYAAKELSPLAHVSDVPYLIKWNAKGHTVNPTAVPGIKIILIKEQKHIGYSEENIKNKTFFFIISIYKL